jgi:hypothetical protein
LREPSRARPIAPRDARSNVGGKQADADVVPSLRWKVAQLAKPAPMQSIATGAPPTHVCKMFPVHDSLHDETSALVQPGARQIVSVPSGMHVVPDRLHR